MKKIIISMIIVVFIVLCGCSSQNSGTTAKDQIATTTQIKSESTIQESTAIPETTTKENTTSSITTTKDQDAQKDYADKNAENADPSQESNAGNSNNSSSSGNTSSSSNNSSGSGRSSSSSGSSSSSHQHSMPTGNMGKWFDSRNSLVDYFNSEGNKWDELYTSGQISYNEYVINSPYGYECWSCSGCGKWTGNFKYR